MMWFRLNNQKEVILSYLPKGRANQQAFISGSNFSNLMNWFEDMFYDLTSRYIQTFKQMFICTAYNVQAYKRDYNIPNDIFYATDDEEHRRDVYVMKYLMKGNTFWHFQAIANIYGINVKIYAGRDFYNQSGFPYKFPIKFRSRMTDDNVIVVVFKYDENRGFPYKFPIKFIKGRKTEKIKKIYQIIKSAETKIFYEQDDTITNERIDLCEN